MKKKIISLLALAAAAVMALTGCYSNTKLSGQETDYIVTSNGGHAVQYGDYVYFVNGTIRGFTDATADRNKWGKVEKGALYRVRLTDGRKDRAGQGSDNAALSLPEIGMNRYYPLQSTDSFAFYDRNDVQFPFPVRDIKSYAEREEDQKDAEAIDFGSEAVTIERVIPKVISYANTGNGGIYIYDNWIYYATPSNRKNKSGIVEYGLTEFYRTKIDGKGTQRIYTSSSAVTDYGVYKYNGKTYLLVYEEGESLLTSIPMTGKKVQNAQTLEAEVTGVHFPQKTNYYNGMPEDTLYDHVFYTRAITADDVETASGNILEMRRPDLAELSYGQLHHKNETYEIAGVSEDTLFYFGTTISGTKTLRADDLSDLIGRGGSIRNIGTIIPSGYGAAVTQVYPFRSGDGFWALAENGGTLSLFTPGVQPITVLSGFSGTILNVYGNTVYYTNTISSGEDEEGSTGGTGSLYSVSLVDPYPAALVTERTIYTGENFGVDVAGGLLFFLVDSMNQDEFAEELAEGAGGAMYVKVQSGADAQNPEYYLGVLVEDIDLPEEED